MICSFDKPLPFVALIDADAAPVRHDPARRPIDIRYPFQVEARYAEPVCDVRCAEAAGSLLDADGLAALERIKARILAKTAERHHVVEKPSADEIIEAFDKLFFETPFQPRVAVDLGREPAVTVIAPVGVCGSCGAGSFDRYIDKCPACR
jgi:hypothetical protein